MTNLEVARMLRTDALLAMNVKTGKTADISLRAVAPELARHLLLAAEALERS
jgi:hypothetical protein